MTGDTVRNGNNHSDGSFAIMMYYTSHTQLSTTLNLIYANLYDEPSDRGKWTSLLAKQQLIMLEPNLAITNLLSQYLENWRQSLPKEMRWDDDEHQTSDINAARMRATYYGTKSLIFRRVLQYVMLRESSSLARRNASPASQNIALGGDSLVGTDPSASTNTTHPSQSVKIKQPQVWRACEQCVRAATRSITAFDRVPKRPIIPNFFGTAQA